MKYFVEISKKIKKIIQNLPKDNKNKIYEKIEALAENPRPMGHIKLKGSDNEPEYRIRSGNYRIIYKIKDHKLIVLIIDVGHRKDIYDNS